MRSRGGVAAPRVAPTLAAPRGGARAVKAGRRTFSRGTGTRRRRLTAPPPPPPGRLQSATPTASACTRWSTRARPPRARPAATASSPAPTRTPAWRCRSGRSAAGPGKPFTSTQKRWERAAAAVLGPGRHGRVRPALCGAVGWARWAVGWARWGAGRARIADACMPLSPPPLNASQVTAAIVTCGGLCPGLNDVVQNIVFTLTDYGAAGTGTGQEQHPSPGKARGPFQAGLGPASPGLAGQHRSSQLTPRPLEPHLKKACPRTRSWASSTALGAFTTGTPSPSRSRAGPWTASTSRAAPCWWGGTPRPGQGAAGMHMTGLPGAPV